MFKKELALPHEGSSDSGRAKSKRLALANSESFVILCKMLAEVDDDKPKQYKA